MTYITKSDELGGFDDAFVDGAGGLVLAAFSIVIGLGETFAYLITNPVTAFGDVSGMLIRAGFGGPARFIQNAWNTAAVLLGVGPWRALGPFVAVVAAVVVVLFLAILAWYADRINSDTLTGINVPIINRDTGGDQADENG